MQGEIVSCNRCAQLEGALESRATIGVALGLLMEREQLDQDEALHRLKTISTTTNRKMREIAHDLVAQANRAAIARVRSTAARPTASN